MKLFQGYKRESSKDSYGSITNDSTATELPLLTHVPDSNRSHTEEGRFHTSGEASIMSEVFNISKNSIGGGVLSLSGGIAMYANDPRAAISATIWVVLLGATFAYFCILIGKACAMTHSETYRECWRRSVGQKGSNFVSLVNIMDPLLGIYGNAAILSQSLQSLLQGIDIHWSAQFCLVLITAFGILPLCMMKNLNALAPFSAIGMVSVLCALLAMTMRLLDGSYNVGGQFYEDQRAKPKFGTSSHPLSISALPFVCMVYTSFDMHYNSPSYYVELKDTSIPRFSTAVSWSFTITSIVYFSIAIVGFWTFGASCDSYILNNYSPKDPLATVGRLAIGLCSLCSYPLNYISIRDNVIELYQLESLVSSRWRLNLFTFGFLTVLTITECFITDLGLINAFGGGTFVTLICFVLPTMMFRQGIEKYGKESDKAEVWFVTALASVGVVLGVTGVIIAVSTA